MYLYMCPCSSNDYTSSTRTSLWRKVQGEGTYKSERKFVCGTFTPPPPPQPPTMTTSTTTTNDNSSCSNNNNSNSKNNNSNPRLHSPGVTTYRREISTVCSDDPAWQQNTGKGHYGTQSSSGAFQNHQILRLPHKALPLSSDDDVVVAVLVFVVVVVSVAVGIAVV